jgi:hypothetical protein
MLISVSQFNDGRVTTLQHGLDRGILPMSELFSSKKLWL